MNVIVLGSGTAVPHPRRSSAGFWIETSGRSLMLDVAPSALLRLAQEGVDWPNVDAIWISHFHLDHCGGLPAFLFATRHAPETVGRQKPLNIIGGRGLKDLIGKFDDVNSYKLFEQPFPIRFTEVDPLQRFEILPGVFASTLKTPHTDESLAVRIENGYGQTLVYTSDTGNDAAISVFAKDADLLIIESSFVKDKKRKTHLELAEAMHLIEEAHPKRAMLTHFYAEWDEVDFAEEVSRFEPTCEIIEARDGLRVEI